MMADARQRVMRPILNIEWSTQTTEDIYIEMSRTVREAIDATSRAHADAAELARWAAEYPYAGPDREALDELRGVQ